MKYTRREINKLRNPEDDYPWDDLRVPMQNTRINPANSEPAYEEWIDGVFAYHFDDENGAGNSLHFSAQIPHSYAEGTALHPHLHWAPTTADAGNVVWEFEYIIANVDGTFASSATNSTVTTAADGVANKHQIVEFDPMDGDYTISAMIMCRLTRLGDDAADTYAEDAVVLEFDFHFQQDAPGSFHEYYKLTDYYRTIKGEPKKKFICGKG